MTGRGVSWPSCRRRPRPSSPSPATCAPSSRSLRLSTDRRSSGRNGPPHDPAPTVPRARAPRGKDRWCSSGGRQDDFHSLCCSEDERHVAVSPQLTKCGIDFSHIVRGSPSEPGWSGRKNTGLGGKIASEARTSAASFARSISGSCLFRHEPLRQPIIKCGNNFLSHD